MSDMCQWVNKPGSKVNFTVVRDLPDLAGGAGVMYDHFGDPDGSFLVMHGNNGSMGQTAEIILVQVGMFIRKNDISNEVVRKTLIKLRELE